MNKIIKGILDRDFKNCLYSKGIFEYKVYELINKEYEVKEIDTLGKPFDPTYHQAVLTDKVDDKEPGIVLEVYQKGYMYKDKVIRVSMVKVNE